MADEDGQSPSLGERLDEITRRMDKATELWARCGHPSSGPIHDAREAVFADLRAWTADLRALTHGPSHNAASEVDQ